jgi:hypothetical protein
VLYIYYRVAAVGFLATSAEQYAEAMAYVVDNKDNGDMQELREKARQSCERFSDNVFINDMTSILREYI